MTPQVTILQPSEASACVVTRGDHDLSEIIDSLSDFAEINVYNNRSEEDDLAVYGRYEAIARAAMPVVYVQDDDCLVDAAAVCAAYEPGLIVANMPESRWADYPDSCLVGWGAVFDKSLADRAFEQFSNRAWHLEGEGTSDERYAWYLRTCDVVFSTLIPHRKIDVGYRHLPWAEGPGRMFTTDYAAHKAERDRMLELARQVRDSVGSC